MLQKGLALPYCRWKLKLERDEFHGPAWVKAQASKILNKVASINKHRWYPQQEGGHLHCKVDINYDLFFALAVLIFNATEATHCGKVQKCTFKVLKSYVQFTN